MLLINRNFALLWGGQLISQLGDKFYTLALLWWLLEQTGSSVATSVFLMLAILPEMLFGPVAGVYVDRWNKKTLLIACDIVRAALVLALAVLCHAGTMRAWHVDLAAVCLSLCAALANPAIMSLIPAVVPEDALPGANARCQMAAGATRVLGPLLGASSLAVIGYTNVLLVNAASYLLAATADGLLPGRPAAPAATAMPAWRSLQQGLRHIALNRPIVAIVALVALVHIVFGGLIAILPFVAQRMAGHGLNNLGILESALGLGIVAGSLYLSAHSPGAVQTVRFARPIGVMALSVVLLGLLQRSEVGFAAPYAVVCAAIGICVAILGTNWQTAIQRRVDADMRGRVFSVLASAGALSLPVSMVTFGLLLKVAPPSMLLVPAGIGLALIGLAMTKARRLFGDA